jgi:hypothetical protein
LFENNTLVVAYGDDKEATFTIVDEEFAGLNNLGRVNCVVIVVKDLTTLERRMCSAVIGLGDGIVGIKTDEASLRGKLLTRDNMSLCMAELYE